jgi:hypothetical protein
MESYYILQ